MRHNFNAEIAEVAEHLADKHRVRNGYDVRRLICDYPQRPKVDFVAQHLAEDFAHDSIHNLSDVEDDYGDESEAAASESYGETAVAAD